MIRIFRNQLDFSRWPRLKEKLALVFKTKTRDAWCKIMEGSDVCFAPVLSMSESARTPPQQAAGNLHRKRGGCFSRAPAPRFFKDGTPKFQGHPPPPGQDTENVLTDFGFSDPEIESLKSSHVI